MRTGVIIVALCAVSYGDPAVFRHDDTVTRGCIGVIDEQPVYYELRRIFEGWGEYSNLVLACKDTVLTGRLDVSLYSEDGFWNIDDVYRSAELSPEERSAAGDICVVYCGSGEPLFESMNLTADTLEMDVSFTPFGNSVDTLHCVWLWENGKFSQTEPLMATESEDF
jgi:hypothetical protein